MGLPRKLKNMNSWGDGNSWLGEVAEITLPKLGRKFEGYRGAGMDGEVQIDMGQENLEMEIKSGGFLKQAYNSFGLTTIDAMQIRFAGAYQADDVNGVNSVEVVVRGRYQEIDGGTSKPGDPTEQTDKFACCYYRLTIDGRDIIEIDIMNLICKVNGVDRLAAQRAAIGL